MSVISDTTWPTSDAREYLLDKVTVCSESKCWLWSQRVGQYGMAGVPVRHRGARIQIAAHRLAYEAFMGRIPDELHVCHRCDTPACCNPDHLFLGTHAENMADMKEKLRTGRHRKDREAASMLSDAALALLVEFHAQPDMVPTADPKPLRELERTGLVAFVDGLPCLTTRGVNAAVAGLEVAR